MGVLTIYLSLPLEVIFSIVLSIPPGNNWNVSYKNPRIWVNSCNKWDSIKNFAFFPLVLIKEKGILIRAAIGLFVNGSLFRILQSIDSPEIYTGNITKSELTPAARDVS